MTALQQRSNRHANTQAGAASDLPRLLQQLGAAEATGDEGGERVVARGWNFDFEEISAPEFVFEMLERACARVT